MRVKSLALGVALVLMTNGCLGSGQDDEEEACSARSADRPTYTLAVEPIRSPTPSVGVETGLFVSLELGSVLCHWSDGEADWFTGEAESPGCHCALQSGATSYSILSAGCPNGSCDVVRIGAQVDLFGSPRREIRLVPHASVYDLHIETTPDRDPSVVLEWTYEGEAPGS